MELFYILHQRSYRETSYLIEALSEQQGRISLIARGAKRTSSAWNHLLQPFRLLVGDWSGKGDLYLLRSVELVPGATQFLSGKKLLMGFYLNELLINLLHQHDPCPAIFALYKEVIQSELTEVNLRCFEIKLLTELGYGLNILHDTHGQSIHDRARYAYHAEEGCTLINSFLRYPEAIIFSGKNLLAIAEQNFSDAAILKDAKRLMRLKFQYLLGGKQLKSRELFI